MTPPPLSDGFKKYRGAMWVMTLLGLLALLVAVGGILKWVPLWVGLLGSVGFIASLCAAGILGVKAHHQALSDRGMESRRAIIVMIATQLGKQDDATLTRIATRKGLAGDAATLILKGRKEKGKPEVVSGKR